MPWRKSHSSTYHHVHHRRRNHPSWRELKQVAIAVLYLVICPILGIASLAQGRTGLAVGYAAISIFACIAVSVHLYLRSTERDDIPGAARA